VAAATNFRDKTKQAIQKTTMKLIRTQVIEKLTLLVSSLFVSAALLGIFSGCATAMKAEDALTASGFRARPAATVEQQEQLKSLPARKVSSVQKDGKKYFVYPDAARNIIYIGQSAEYQRYQKIRAKWKLPEEQLNPAEQMQFQWSPDGL
jgi:hypothetical protein